MLREGDCRGLGGCCEWCDKGWCEGYSRKCTTLWCPQCCNKGVERGVLRESVERVLGGGGLGGFCEQY